MMFCSVLFCSVFFFYRLEPHDAYRLNKLLKDISHFSAQQVVKDSSAKLKLAQIFASYV